MTQHIRVLAGQHVPTPFHAGARSHSRQRIVRCPDCRSGSAVPRLNRSSKKAFPLFALLLALQMQAMAAPMRALGGGRLACGTPHHASEAIVLHRQSSRLPSGVRPRLLDPVVDPVSHVDGIALIEATSEMWVPPQEFDLAGFAVSITPDGESATVQTARLPDPVPISESGVLLELEDDDSALIDLPFAFPFYGRTYRQVYVQSDGNLTFLFPEARSDPRTYTRAAFGPPRICPLFKDLDPSVGGSVRVDARSDSVTISWLEVPLYSEFGIGRAQTFQVTLGERGDVGFRYGDVDVPNAVVGTFTGIASSGVEVVDFSDADGAEIDSGNIVAEVFVEEQTLDEFAIAHAFYRQHEDAYDALVIFNDFHYRAGPYSFAHQFTVRNEVKGIGDYLLDYGTVFGSRRRLSSFVNMGPMSQYPVDPIEPIPSLLGDTMLSVLAHELGHRYLAYPTFHDPETGEASELLLGRQFAHWSFFLDSQGSVMEGNSIQDSGPAVSPRFVTGEPSQRYSKLDQYLMGLLDPSAVPSFFVVTSPTGVGRTPRGRGSSIGSAARSPEEGIEFNGVRKDVRVEDIVSELGPRRPDSTVAQRHFRHVFALVVPEGEEPKPESLETLAELRRNWVGFFETNAGSRASVATGVVQMLHLSTWPASGLVKGFTGSARIEIGAPLEEDFDVRLLLEPAIAEVPSAITIPAGETEATFEVTGLSEGIATFTAEAPVAGYSRAVTRLIVRDGLEGLEIESGQSKALHGIVGGTPATVRFRVRDENLVHYSGVGLEYCATGFEECPAAMSTTNPDGVAVMHWPFHTSAGTQELVTRLAGLPEISTETSAIVTLGAPALDASLGANAASGSIPSEGQGFAPGSLITLPGSGLAAEAAEYGTRLVSPGSDEDGEPLPPPRSLPRELVGSSVSLGGVAAPLVRIAPESATLQVPFGIVGDSAHVVVRTPFGTSPVIQIPIAPAQPGIFPGRIVAGNLDGPRSAFQPADDMPSAGGLIALYSTGLGAVSPPGRTGRPGLADPVQRVITPVKALIDGKAAAIAACALDTREVGVYEVVLRLPGDLQPGQHSVWLVVGGQASNRDTFESR